MDTRPVKLTAWLGLGLYATACATRTLASGEAIDLSQCVGSGCADADLAPSQLDYVRSRCEPGDAQPLATLWSHGLTDPPCAMENLCGAPPRLAVAADGSVWVLALTGAAVPGGTDISLTHLDSEGAVLSRRAVDSQSGSVAYQTSLAVDDRGHVFVAIKRTLDQRDADKKGWTATTTTADWVVEFDSQGEQLGDVIPVAAEPRSGPAPVAVDQGGLRLWAMPGSQIALGIPQPAQFATLDEEHWPIGVFGTDPRALRWVRDRDGRRSFQSLAVDDRGGLSVLVKPMAEPDAAGLVESYDAEGRLVSLVSLAGLQASDTGDLQGMSGHRAGELFLSIQAAPSETGEYAHQIVRIGPDRRTAWVVSMPVFDATELFAHESDLAVEPVIDPSGEVLVPSGIYIKAGDEVVPQQHIYALRGDGESCTVYKARSDAKLRSLSAGPNGELYFTSDGGYGRILR